MSSRRLVLRSTIVVACCCVFAGREARSELGGHEGMAVEVEIVRPENNGLMNLVPAAIVVSGGPAASKPRCRVGRGPENRDVSRQEGVVLFGGDRVTCTVWATSLSIEAFTPKTGRPPGLSARSANWDATKMTMLLDGADKIRIELLPKARGSTYIGGWRLLRRS